MTRIRIMNKFFYCIMFHITWSESFEPGDLQKGEMTFDV